MAKFFHVVFVLILGFIASASFAQSLSVGGTQNSSVLVNQMGPGTMYINKKTAIAPYYGSSLMLAQQSCNINTNPNCNPLSYACVISSGANIGIATYVDGTQPANFAALPSNGPNAAMYNVQDTGYTYAYFSSSWQRCVQINAANQTQAPSTQPAAPGPTGGAGSFRVNCALSHFGYDDPIVHPGAPGTTHLHGFVGNTSTSAASDLSDMSLSGNSSCVGGMANGSGYWFPVPFYHCPLTAIGCNHARDGEIVRFSPLANVYYKCNFFGGGDCTRSSYGGAPMQWAPIGFRVITGDANARVPLPNGGTSGLRLLCFNTVTEDTSNGFDRFPTPQEAAGHIPHNGGSNVDCDEINMFQIIPDCVAVDSHGNMLIDSPDHKSHTANSGGDPTTPDGGGCRDPNFPINIVGPTMNQHFHVQSIADWAYIRLSSDPACADEGGPAGSYTDTLGNPILCNGKPNNGQPGGWTLHMDWVNGWSHNPNFMGWGKGSITDIIKRNCYNMNGTASRGIDCHDWNIGNVNGDGIYWQVAPLQNPNALKQAR